MNDHINEAWEHPHPRRHRGGGRYRSRPVFPGFDPREEGFGPGSHHDHGPEFGPVEFEGPVVYGPGFRGGPPGFGPPGFGPRGRGYGRRGGRPKRGDVRAAALALLAEEPMNGYQIIQQISERSGGLWQPSPGSVYPALAQLEDEGLIEAQAAEAGRRGFALTQAGRDYVAEHAEQLKDPWSAITGGAASAAADLRSLVRQVHMAAVGVLTAGTDDQVSQARKILVQTRRSLYRILAEDDQAGQAAREPADTDGD